MVVKKVENNEPMADVIKKQSNSNGVQKVKEEDEWRMSQVSPIN